MGYLISVDKWEYPPETATDREFVGWAYEKLNEFMFKTARSYGFASDEAEDVVQDSIIKLINNVSTLRQYGPSGLAGYVKVTVENTCRDRIRANKRRANVIDFRDDLSFSESPYNWTPEAIEKTMYEKEKIMNLFKVLSEKERFVLMQKHGLGCSNKEIAKMLDCSEDSVRMTLLRVRRKAREGKAALSDKE